MNEVIAEQPVQLAEEPLEASAPIEEQAQADPAIVTLTVTFNQRTREVFVNGPILDKFLCYGILEVAKDAVRDFISQKREESAANAIVPAFTIPANLKRNGKG